MSAQRIALFSADCNQQMERLQASIDDQRIADMESRGGLFGSPRCTGNCQVWACDCEPAIPQEEAVPTSMWEPWERERPLLAAVIVALILTGAVFVSAVSMPKGTHFISMGPTK